MVETLKTPNASSVGFIITPPPIPQIAPAMDALKSSFILKQTAAALGIPTRVFSVHPGRMKTAMGAENGQIEAAESAEGIYRLAVGEVLADNREIYVDYRGNAMLHQAGRKE